jgi:hypothetical protein
MHLVDECILHTMVVISCFVKTFLVTLVPAFQSLQCPAPSTKSMHWRQGDQIRRIFTVVVVYFGHILNYITT